MSTAIRETFFDRLAERYESDFESNPLARYQRRRVHALLAPLLKPGLRLLDVGCGTGADFPFYRQAGVQVTALDVSPAMLARARRRAEQLHWPVELLCQDFNDFQPEQPFHGAVFNFGVLNAFSNPAATLVRAARMVLPAGFALVVVMPPLHPAWMAGQLLHGQWTSLRQRCLHRTLTLPSGFTVRYVDRRDIPPCWQVLRAVSLGLLLPPPGRLKADRRPPAALKLACLLDRLCTSFLPAALGGDHVAYLLKRKPEPLP
ncbi:MAG: class I SAM-dependent methyltransferase [Calditrichaeota bacterium]|nr:MAG: class I SAM-dependent methyltransferase [Calditrichota bacterium]